jgi:TetR/AcrR family transcriptional regulator
MASALKLLKRDGYRRVRLEDIAEDAGVCKATVYHYFANKDDLLTRSVASRMAERHVDVEQRLARAGGSAADRLRLFLHEFWTMSLSTQSGLWQRLIIAEMASEAPDVFAAWARGFVQRWRLVETLIKEGQDSGEFRRSADAGVTARLIVSALAHQALFHVHLGVRRFAPCDVDRLFESSLEHLLHGLRPSTHQASSR